MDCFLFARSFPSFFCTVFYLLPTVVPGNGACKAGCVGILIAEYSCILTLMNETLHKVRLSFFQSLFRLKNRKFKSSKTWPVFTRVDSSVNLPILLRAVAVIA